MIEAASPGSNQKQPHPHKKTEADGGPPNKDSDDLNESKDSEENLQLPARHRKWEKKQYKENDKEDNLSKGNSFELVILMYARQESKWSGLGDSNLSSAEFI